MTVTIDPKLLAKLKAQDALLNFKPSPVQASYLQSDSPFRVIIGGNRAGKTTTNAVDLAYIARGLHPWRKLPFKRKLRILILTNTRAQAANVFGRKLFTASELPGRFHDTPLIPPNEVSVDYLKVGVHVPYAAQTRHAEMLFAWSAADNVWERLQGQKLDLCYFDEDAGTKKLVEEIFMRGMDARSAQEAPWLGGINWSATPTTSTDGYLHFRRYCQENTPSKSYFYIPPGDNPAISKEATAEARKFLGARQSQVRVDGTKDATDLILIYGEQWKDARHLAPACPVTPATNLWLGYDPGMDHPTGMVLAATNPDYPLRLNIVRTWVHARQTLEFDARVLDEFLCGRRLAGIVYDYAAKAQLKDGGSVIDTLMGILARKQMSPLFGFFQAKKAREAGISMVRHYLDPDPYDPLAPTLLRLDEPTEQNGNGILRQQFLAYRGKESTRFTGEGGVVKKDDDAMDAMRYLCMHRIGYNADGACGEVTKAQLNPEQAPQVIATPAPPVPEDPYSRHLALSRERRPRTASRWTEADF
jgi:hypothetical protein